MKIEEILSEAGVTDEAVIKAVQDAMPKNFVPLDELNKRVAAAKKEAADVTAQFDAYKADVEKAQTEAAANGDESAKALEELQQKYADLEGKFTSAQDAIKQRDAKAALTEALKGNGANPAAIELLAQAALSSVEYGEDGKPANVQDLIETVKEANAGLFGKTVDTGSKSPKADEPNEGADAFLKGFGKTN